jgi:DNA processing protein
MLGSTGHLAAGMSDGNLHLRLARCLERVGRKTTRRALADLLHLRTGPGSVAVGPVAQRLDALLRKTGNQPSRPPLEPMVADALIGGGGQSLLSWFDPDFPEPLRQIPDPPLLLYLQGPSAALNGTAVAVVGARRCTRLGSGLAESFAERLAGLGLVVVSGLAYGIDAAAHRGALRTGVTVAVLGSGLGNVQPRSHRSLGRRILESGGCLLSEYPAATPGAKHRFPERNRLISGLCRGVIVVEAGERSGSLITAGFALEQGREVMAVPGPVGSGVSRGCHRLLRDGAALVEDVDDVLATLDLDGFGASAAQGDGSGAMSRMRSRAAEFSDSHAAVLEVVASLPTPLDEILAATGLPAEQALARLVDLELDGFVERSPGGYSRRPRLGR